MRSSCFTKTLLCALAILQVTESLPVDKSENLEKMKQLHSFHCFVQVTSRPILNLFQDGFAQFGEGKETFLTKSLPDLFQINIRSFKNDEVYKLVKTFIRV